MDGGEARLFKSTMTTCLVGLVERQALAVESCAVRGCVRLESSRNLRA